MFLEQQISYYNDFWMIMWHWILSFTITGMNYLLKYIQTENILICNISQEYCTFYYISDQINAALVSIWDIFQKHLNIEIIKKIDWQFVYTVGEMISTHTCMPKHLSDRLFYWKLSANLHIR